MLQLYIDLFQRLNDGIPYAAWKEGHTLQQALNGEGDIDLLVAPSMEDLFQKIMREQRFISAQFRSLHFPRINHLYGYDDETDKFCHLHVSFELVTGESHLKQYQLPFAEEVLEYRFLNNLGVYEASYRDQALLYTMRHYMKRASLFGFVLWLLERRDYYNEYFYIINCLNIYTNCESAINENLHSDYDFYKIDLEVGLASLFIAHNKVRQLYRYNRLGYLRKITRGLQNILIRTQIKIFQIKKSLSRGAVIAISGVDGAGKSTLVADLSSWLGREFDVKVVHLGRPPSNILTFPFRPLLYIFRVLRSCAQPDKLKKSSSTGKGLVFAIRQLVLGYERYRLALLAHQQACGGKIVISDRYPTCSLGKMDSPQIDKAGRWFIHLLGKWEARFYQKLPLADRVIFLDVSLDVAIHRNRSRIKHNKEKDGEIQQRYENNRNLEFRAKECVVLDANREYSAVLHDAKTLVWETLQRRC